MKARRLIKKNDGGYDIVFFGSKGIKPKITYTYETIENQKSFNLNVYPKSQADNIINITVTRNVIEDTLPSEYIPSDILTMQEEDDEEGFYNDTSITFPNLPGDIKSIKIYYNIYAFNNTDYPNNIDFNNPVEESDADFTYNPALTEQFIEIGYGSNLYDQYLLQLSMSDNNTLNITYDNQGLSGSDYVLLTEIYQIDYECYDIYYSDIHNFTAKLTYEYFVNYEWETDSEEKQFEAQSDTIINCQFNINNIINTIHPNALKFSNFNLEINYSTYSLDAELKYLSPETDLVENLNKNDPNYYNKSITLNYSEQQEGVRDSLIVRLSVIKGELWYRSSYGLPLLDKIKSKGIYDSIIVDNILSHPDVVNLESFNSKIDGHTYYFDCVVNTIYNEKITLSNKL